MGHINMSIYWDWYNSCPPAFFHSCKCVTSPLSNQKPCKRQLSTITPLFCAKLMRRINARQIGHLTYLTCNYSAAENYRNMAKWHVRRTSGAPKALAVALSFCRLGWGCPKQAFAKIATPRYFVFFRYTVLLAHEILESLLPIGG
jgi:hypothetical protein